MTNNKRRVISTALCYGLCGLGRRWAWKSSGGVWVRGAYDSDVEAPIAVLEAKLYGNEGMHHIHKNLLCSVCSRVG